MSDHGTCAYCGVALTHPNDDAPTAKHRDHLIPRSRGGSDDVENCAVACRSCNLNKRDKTPSEWRPTGLPAWVYEVEARLTIKYRMPARGARVAPNLPSRVIGFDMIGTKSPGCLEYDKRVCLNPADWEIYDIISGSWGAKCRRCVRYYLVPDHVRELDDARRALHVLVQLKDGTLDRNRETVLLALARAGGVSFETYVDLVVQMISGEPIVRAHLKATFPDLNLSVWEPTVS